MVRYKLDKWFFTKNSKIYHYCTTHHMYINEGYLCKVIDDFNIIIECSNCKSKFTLSEILKRCII